MTALGIFVFLGQWNNFFQPLIFLNTEDLFTIPLVVNYFKGAYSSDWTSLMAATTMAALPDADRVHRRAEADRRGHRPVGLEDVDQTSPQQSDTQHRWRSCHRC